MNIHEPTYKMHIPYSKKALERLIYEEGVNLADIDTSHIRDMSDLFSAEFHDPEDIRHVNNPSGLRGWDTSSTFNFHNMFRGAQFGDSVVKPTWRGTRLIDFHGWDMRNALFIDGMFDGIREWKPFGIHDWVLPKVMDASSFMSDPGIGDAIFSMHLPASCRGQDMLASHPEVVPHYVDAQSDIFWLSAKVVSLGQEIKTMREEVDTDIIEDLKSLDLDSLSALTEYDLSGLDDLCSATYGMDYSSIKRAFEDIAENGTATDRLDSMEHRLDELEERLDRIDAAVERLDSMVSDSEDMVDPAEMNEMVMAFRSIRAILRGERHD